MTVWLVALGIHARMPHVLCIFHRINKLPHATEPAHMPDMAEHSTMIVLVSTYVSGLPPTRDLTYTLHLTLCACQQALQQRAVKILAGAMRKVKGNFPQGLPPLPRVAIPDAASVRRPRPPPLVTLTAAGEHK